MFADVVDPQKCNTQIMHESCTWTCLSGDYALRRFLFLYELVNALFRFKKIDARFPIANVYRLSTIGK